MQTKLTIRMDSKIIQRAKALAKKRGTSVSRLVSDYFTGATAASSLVNELPPITRLLAGSLKGVDEAAYRQYLEDKHR